MEFEQCRNVYGDRYIRMSASIPSFLESQRLSFSSTGQRNKPGLRLERHEVEAATSLHHDSYDPGRIIPRADLR